MEEGSSIFHVIFWIVIFFCIFALGLNVIVGTGISIAFLTTPRLSGLEAFTIYNLMLWIIVAFILWILWITK